MWKCNNLDCPNTKLHFSKIKVYFNIIYKLSFNIDSLHCKVFQPNPILVAIFYG